MLVRDGGDRARLWSVRENRGETSHDGVIRVVDLVVSEHLADLSNRFVIGWRAPRTWWLSGQKVAGYPVAEIADAQPASFPGFGHLVLDHAQLERAGRGVGRRHRRG